MKLGEFVRVPTVSNRAKVAVQILKDEALTPLLTIGIFGHLSCIHLATHSIFHTLLNFEEMTSLEVVNNSENEDTSLARITFLFA